MSSDKLSSGSSLCGSYSISTGEFWLRTQPSPSLDEAQSECISVAGSLPGLFLGLHNGTDPDRVLTQLLRFERTADATSAILLILISAVLLWFPIKVRRNAAAYMAGFVVYFVGHSAGLLASDLWPQLQTPVNTALLILPIVCMLFWIMVMRPEGEIRTLTGHSWNPEEADRLRRKLDEINDRLEKVLH
jgi:hypothetical protein